MRRLVVPLIALLAGLLAAGCGARAGGPVVTAHDPPTPVIAAPSPTLAFPTPMLEPTADRRPPTAAVTATPLSSETAPPSESAPPGESAPPTPAVTPSAIPSPTPCAQPGRVEQGALESAIAGEPMRYRVYLPPCYDVDNRDYPTLYMFGGNIHDEKIWDNLGLDEAAEALITAGTIPPLLIVMPDNGWLANTTTSGPNSYEGFVLNELMPHIEATYRARSDAGGRAVGGLSRGGYWSLMMSFRRPDLFRSVGAHSPALIDSHAGPAEDPRITGATNDLGDLRIWIDIGERDPYLSEARPLHEALTAAGVAHEWRVEAGTHEEAYWQAHLEQYLMWYSQGWPNVPPAPPTPGPEPTSLPESLEGATPVTTEVDALERAIFLDSVWATRDTPLTMDRLLANPDSYIIESYSTWQEASDHYGFGTIVDNATASQPVWVVILKGDVIVNSLGGSVQSDGITFIISQQTGNLMSMASGALQKR